MVAAVAGGGGAVSEEEERGHWVSPAALGGDSGWRGHCLGERQDSPPVASGIHLGTLC